jgi:hypothetical protein
MSTGGSPQYGLFEVQNDDWLQVDYRPSSELQCA